jgi:hypothetical protein
VVPQLQLQPPRVVVNARPNEPHKPQQLSVFARSRSASRDRELDVAKSTSPNKQIRKQPPQSPEATAGRRPVSSFSTRNSQRSVGPQLVGFSFFVRLEEVGAPSPQSGPQWESHYGLREVPRVASRHTGTPAPEVQRMGYTASA